MLGICRICGDTVDPNAPGGEWDVCLKSSCFDAASARLDDVPLADKIVIDDMGIGR